MFIQIYQSRVTRGVDSSTLLLNKMSITWQVYKLVFVVSIVQIAKKIDKADANATPISNDIDQTIRKTSTLNPRNFSDSNTSQPGNSHIQKYRSTERSEIETGEYF